MSSAKPIKGVLPVFQTPYLEDETIDFQTLAREFDFLFAQGVDGVVMAMVSEILRLSLDERKHLAESAVRLVNGRGTVTISVGAESTKVAEDLARHAQSIGADALMAIPPTTVRADENELLRYFGRIISAVNIPVIVQDASSYVGTSLSIALYVKMLDEFGDRLYFKPEANPIGPRLTALLDASNKRARVFEGTGGIALVDSYRRGIAGTMPGADLIRAVVALWRALVRGDERTIYRINGPLAAILSHQNTLDSFLAIEKYLLVKQGIFRNTLVRGPVGYTLDPHTRAEIDRLFDVLLAALPEVAQ